jgi:hypothetical protein
VNRIVIADDIRLQGPRRSRGDEGPRARAKVVENPTCEVNEMDQQTMQREQLMRDGEDFVCPNCGCEIMLKHHGDESKMQNMRPFTCCCGTQMRPEHPTS